MDLSAVVNEILNTWSPYQYLVSSGQGGQYTAEKDVWFRETLTQFISETSNLDSMDIADYMDEILNHEFDSIFEDGSVETTASIIHDCYTHLKRNRTDEVTKMLSLLREAASKSTNAVAANDGDAANDSFSEEDDEDKASASTQQPMDTEESDTQATKKSWHSEPDDDGWCTVKNPKNRSWYCAQPFCLLLFLL